MKLPKRIRKLPVFGRMTISPAQEKALDTLWAIAVKARAGYKCEKCFKNEGLQAHHAVGKRRNKTLRHVVSNGFSLCAGHHMWSEQDGIDFAQWAIKQRGQKWWDDLKAYGREVKVWKDFTLMKEYLNSFITAAPEIERLEYEPRIGKK